MTESANVIVTGASRGLGLALVERLARCPPIIPLKIIATYRSLLPNVRIIPEDNVSIEWYKLDVCATSSIESFAWRLEHKYGKRIDVLINNAGFNQDAQLPYAFPTCSASLATNFEGTYALTKALLPLLRRPGHPALCARSRILNVSCTDSKATVPKGYSGQTLQRFLTATSMDQLCSLAQAYKQAFRTNQLRAHGWPVGKSHEISKLFVNCMTRIIARANKNDLLINACSPRAIVRESGTLILMREQGDTAIITARIAFDPTINRSGFLWEAVKTKSSEHDIMRTVEWIG